MLTPAPSPQSGTDDTSPSAISLGARIPWRALAAAAVLAAFSGVALAGVLAKPHSTVAPPASRSGLSILPLAAQGQISAALGADQRAYRVSRTVGGLAAFNPAQRLHVRFGRSGLLISSRGVTFGLGLRAVGYGSSMTPVGEVRPIANANRVSYARARVAEWYANGPLGLEQGFTIPKPLGSRHAAPLTLSIALSGAARASLSDGGKGVTLGHPGGSSLRYDGLRAVDARGRTLHSWFALGPGAVLLRVDTRDARYPVRIDPFFQQGEKLTPTGKIGETQFGMSVALSGDGDTALIGASKDNEGVGAAWVFTRSGEEWTQHAKLTASGEIGHAFFGAPVALSADGRIALIGGAVDNNDAGAAWVFTRSGASWVQRAKLTGGGELFGGHLALSGDGRTALIGTYGYPHGTGDAWVFTRSGEEWAQQGPPLTPSDPTKSEFPPNNAATVALSFDGNTALIARPYDGSTLNADVGAAWVFTRSGEVWTQQGSKLTGGGEVTGEYPNVGLFGWSVALSADGNTALIGGRGDNNSAGAAWVFTRSADQWVQQGEKLTGTAKCCSAPLFGNSVALSADGNTALIGSWTYSGAAWAFTRSGTTWSLQGEALTSGENSGTLFGASVALSSDADTALVGAPVSGSGEGVGGLVSGAWVFANEPAKPPAVVTQAASPVTQAAATLNATVNPDGEAVTDCHFEYGTSQSYGSSLPCSSAPGSGTRPVAVSARLERPIGNNTTYHFRIVATNALGTSYGTDLEFTTERYPVEFGRCIARSGGNYRNSGCSIPATPGYHKYEWYPGVAKTHFTTRLKELTVATLMTVKGKKVTCKLQTGTGQYTGPKTVGGVTLTFAGCEQIGVGKCSSPEASEGEIRSRPLEGALGVWLAGIYSIENKVGLDLFPVGGTGAIMQFTCGSTLVSIQGSVVVPIPANTMKLAPTLPYAQSKGKQKPEGFIAEPRDVLEVSFGEAPFEQTGLTMKTIQTNEEKVEINSVV